MTGQERLRLFEQALDAIAKLEQKYPDYPPFLSIHAQLNFLRAQAAGAYPDGDSLTKINLRMLAAREVETRDAETAELFYQVAAEARIMLREFELIR